MMRRAAADAPTRAGLGPAAPTDIRAIVGHHIAADILGRPGLEIDPEVPLLGTGYLTSLGLLELLEFLERRFLITVVPGDLRGAHFATLSRIAAYVERKLAAGVPPQPAPPAAAHEETP